MSTLAAVLAVLAGAASLAVLHWRGVRRTREERRRHVEELATLLDDAAITQDSIDFPRISGRYRGRLARIEPHLDIIALRKLPSLWLMVTVLPSHPASGTLSVLMRPRNIEYWSPFADQPVDVPRPAQWPEHAHIRASDASMARLASLLESHADFLSDSRCKEILVSGKGVRLTWLAGEGDRGQYLVTRQAAFTGARLDAMVVASLLERAYSLAEAIDRHWETHRDG